MNRSSVISVTRILSVLTALAITAIAAPSSHADGYSDDSESYTASDSDYGQQYESPYDQQGYERPYSQQGYEQDSYEAPAQRRTSYEKPSCKRHDRADRQREQRHRSRSEKKCRKD